MSLDFSRTEIQTWSRMNFGSRLSFIFPSTFSMQPSFFSTTDSNWRCLSPQHHKWRFFPLRRNVNRPETPAATQWNQDFTENRQGCKLFFFSCRYAGHWRVRSVLRNATFPPAASGFFFFWLRSVQLIHMVLFLTLLLRESFTLCGREVQK